MSKQKLELTWIGKEKRPKLEPRILLEDPEKSYHAKHRVSDNDIFDNRLIFGDNLLALKALEQEFSGKVKCVFIDPPYNTGRAFAQYDDGLEHSIWLGLVRDRLEIIRRLLSDDGSLWISIDDNEAHYLKVLCDEIFGRKCFVTSFIWKKADSPNDNKGALSPDHEYILCYVKNPDSIYFRPKQDESILNAYRQPDAESDRPYRDRLLKKNGKNSLRIDRPSMYFPIKGPDGVDVYPIHDDGQEARWAMGKKGVDELIAKGELVWKQRESGGVLRWVPYTREYAPDAPTRPWPTIWSDLHTTRQTKAHQRSVLEGVQAFETPKPEDLVSRILSISTNPGDWVLDSFAGSGTTGAAAHKMGRRWIMVELEETCHTHIIPRLRKVIDGEDKGGVTEALSWHGGGGFRYYRLAPSLIVNDRWGNPVINPEYNAAQLAEALAKLEGFNYAPSETHWWQHGHSSERDFIYVTTQNLSAEQLQALADEVGPERSLLVCCAAFHGVTAAKAAERWPNLTLKKISKMVLARCHWGRDDYSLMYQRECYDALYRYWHEGSAANPRFRPEKTRKALPGGLTVEQQDAIKALAKSRVEILPQGAQAKAAITCWSAVKSKFGVSYKEVPATNFPDVLSLVARLPLDGELLKAPKGKYHFPLSFWQPTNRAGRSGWLTWDELTRIESADLPLSNLLSQLAADGHDVEGARVEYRAMRLLLESMHWTIADIAARVNAIPRLGLSVAF